MYTPRMDYERSLTNARAQLSEADFNAAWEVGRAITPEQAIASAMESESEDSQLAKDGLGASSE